MGGGVNGFKKEEWLEVEEGNSRHEFEVRRPLFCSSSLSTPLVNESFIHFSFLFLFFSV
jgi:hypothetical protein